MNENENRPDRDSKAEQDQKLNQQGQTASGQTEEPTDTSGKQAESGKQGFVGSQSEEQDSGEYLQKDKPNQGGFAEDGQGAPQGSAPGNVEGNRERDANRDSDVEGSSSN